jgi:DNA-binding MarR family transcriptional regulator
MSMPRALLRGNKMNFDQLIRELNEIKSSVVKLSENTPENKNYSFGFIRSHSELLGYTKKYIENRALRQKMIHPGIFSDPSWDILVELFYARLTGRIEYASSISTAGGTSPTTGLRHVSTLEEMGFLTKERQPGDKRRTVVKISDSAFELVRDFFVRTSQN